MDISMSSLVGLKAPQSDDIFEEPVPSSTSSTSVAWIHKISSLLDSTGLKEESDGGKGQVNLPLEALMALMKQASEDQSTPARRAHIASASYNIQCEKGGCKLKAEVEVEVLLDQWTAVPLFSNKLAFSSTSVSSSLYESKAPSGTPVIAPVALVGVFAPPGSSLTWHGLMCNRAGLYKVSMEGVLGYSTPRETGLNFAIPKASRSELVCVIGKTQLEVKVDPCLAMTTTEHKEGRHVGGAKDEEEKEEEEDEEGEDEGSTTVRCVLPPTSSLSVQWTKRVQEEVGEAQVAEELPLTITTEQYTLHSIGEGVLSSTVNMVYSILNAPVSLLQTAIDSRVRITGVTGSGVKKWEVVEPTANAASPEAAEGSSRQRRVLKIFLDHGVESKYECCITSELEMEGESCSLSLPRFAAVGEDIKREFGQLGVETRTNVEVQYLDGRGLAMIDPSELNKSKFRSAGKPGGGGAGAGSGILLAYKFLDPSFNLDLLIKKHSDVDVLIAVIERAHIALTLTEEGRLLNRVVCNVRNTQKQFLRIRLPPNTDVWSTLVGGAAVKPAMDKGGLLMIPLTKSRVSSGGSGGSNHSDFSVELVYLNRPTREHSPADLHEIDSNQEEVGQGKRMQDLKQHTKAYNKANAGREALLSDSEPSDLGDEDGRGGPGVLNVDPLAGPLGTRGNLSFSFPTMDLPINQLFISLWLPSDFKYGEFSGDLKEIQWFSGTLPQANVALINDEMMMLTNPMTQMMSNVAPQMSQMPAAAPRAVVAKEAASSALGVLPVNVEVPQRGKEYKFEQLLYNGEKPLKLQVQYKKIDRKGCWKRRRVNACAIL